MPKAEGLSDKDAFERALEIAEILQGLPISQVDFVLEWTKSLILQGHQVNVANPRFKKVREELKLSCSE